MLYVDNDSGSSVRRQPIRLPSRRHGPFGSVGIRVTIAASCLVVTTLTVYLGRDGYRDITGTPLSLIDALYFATVSLSTTGYGDIVPYTDLARFFNILIITPLRIVFLIVLVGSTLEVLTTRTTTEFREKRWRNRVRNHTIVIGYGVKGRAAAATLLDDGISPDNIVVVCADPVSLDRATTAGLVGVLGNARDEDILSQAGVERAARVVICTDSDDTSVLVTLTIRRMNPTAVIIAAAREVQNTVILRQSGANGVIPTSEAVGRLMAMSLLSPTAGALMEDLLDPHEGLDVVERAIEPREVGKNTSIVTDEGQLLLATLRDGQVHRFDEGVIQTFEQGDRIVVIRHTTCIPT